MKGIIGFFYDEEGLTVVEYVMGAALLVVALTFVFIALEDGLISSFENTLDYVQAQ
ncbi:Flp family type IVb pilin [Vibrio breoganii]|uniref:Flp family type IVb pilin n=1 Tax=Vibrio breoganii TaxID=553239 RepID=UPI0018E46A0E|nr:hypothetical protein [Vibrio breoganii]